MQVTDAMNGALLVTKVWWYLESPPLLINLNNGVALSEWKD